LTCKSEFRGRRTRGIPYFSPRLKSQLGIESPAPVGSYRGRTEMVGQQEVARGSGTHPHGHPLAPRIDVLHHRARAASPFEVVANIDRGRSPDRGLDPLAVAGGDGHIAQVVKVLSSKVKSNPTVRDDDEEYIF